MKLDLLGSESSDGRLIGADRERAFGIGYPDAVVLAAELACRCVGARLKLGRGELAGQPNLDVTASTSADVFVHGGHARP
jgi:hypothetical protein